MHVLVTGGAGFIGSHLVDRLLAEGHRVTVVDNFDPFYDRALKKANLAGHRRYSSWHLVEADLREPARLRVLTGDYDCIVHLAARTGVRPSIDDPIGYHDVNVSGTQHLLEFARARRIPQFVFASSSSVDGINPRVPWSEEDHVLLPISPYASTKVSGELLARACLWDAVRHPLHRVALLHGVRSQAAPRSGVQAVGDRTVVTYGR